MAPAPHLPSRPARPNRWARVALAAVVLAGVTACQATTATDGAAPTSTTEVPRSIDEPSPALTAPLPTAVPRADEPTDEAVASAVDLLVAAAADGPGTPEIERVGLSGDLRQGWVLVDALGVAAPDRATALARALETLTGQAVPAGEQPWVFYGDLLLAWDVPSPPGYLEDKAEVLASFDGGLARFLDPAAPLDWRTVSWSGSPPDAGPALDAPEVALAGDGGAWLAEDDVVFGVVVGGEARAYPRRVLAVHEVVNDTLGGRPIVLAHCRACDATVAFDRATDAEGRMITADGTALDLATTGLLERGAPLLYDRATGSVVRSMVGEAVTGLLGVESRVLQPVAVRTTTWSAWLAAFPSTSVVSDDAGIGRVYLPDAAEPTGPPGWPTGVIDERLPPADRVLGVPQAPDGVVAFAVGPTAEALAAGGTVEHAGVRVVLDGGGLAAVDADDDTPLAAHEANWLTWSAFHPDAAVWTGG
jgi:hypothetical protein